MKAPDLRKSFPRSPGEALGGYVILPRAIDKCRAVIAGTQGEYKFNCPMDRRFFDFTGIDAEEFKNFVADDKSDEEIIAWVKEKTKHITANEVVVWSYDQRCRKPYSIDEKAFYEAYRQKYAPHARNVSTWFEMLDAEEVRFQ